MRKGLAKQVRERFARRLEEELPQFQLVSLANVPPGYKLFQWRVDAGLSFFLLLEIDPKRDRFNVEVSWSRRDRWPESVYTMLPSDKPVDGELRFRLPRLWTEPRASFWWEIVAEPTFNAPIENVLKPPPPVEELLSRTEELVEDSISRLKAEGMSYFNSVIRQLGL